MLKRILSVFLAFAIVLGLGFISFPEASAAGVSLSQLKAKYPSGKYWNHYCSEEKAGDLLVKYKNGSVTQSYAESLSNTVTSTACSYHSSVSSFVGVYDCNFFDGGIQCVGSARKLGYEAFGTRVSTWKTITSISSVKPGDVVTFTGAGAASGGSHTVFVTAVSGTWITVGE